jgi:ABC-type bacteriocin/lantibiotic exporter with double-glycine peptidase domain
MFLSPLFVFQLIFIAKQHVLINQLNNSLKILLNDNIVQNLFYIRHNYFETCAVETLTYVLAFYDKFERKFDVFKFK